MKSDEESLKDVLKKLTQSLVEIIKDELRERNIILNQNDEPNLSIEDEDILGFFDLLLNIQEEKRDALIDALEKMNTSQWKEIEDKIKDKTLASSELLTRLYKDSSQRREELNQAAREVREELRFLSSSLQDSLKSRDDSFRSILTAWTAENISRNREYLETIAKFFLSIEKNAQLVEAKNDAFYERVKRLDERSEVRDERFNALISQRDENFISFIDDSNNKAEDRDRTFINLLDERDNRFRYYIEAAENEAKLRDEKFNTLISQRDEDFISIVDDLNNKAEARDINFNKLLDDRDDNFRSFIETLENNAKSRDEGFETLIGNLTTIFEENNSRYQRLIEGSNERSERLERERQENAKAFTTALDNQVAAMDNQAAMQEAASQRLEEKQQQLGDTVSLIGGIIGFVQILTNSGTINRFMYSTIPAAYSCETDPQRDKVRCGIGDILVISLNILLALVLTRIFLKIYNYQKQYVRTRGGGEES